VYNKHKGDKTMKQQYRQGDVMLVPASKAQEKGARETARGTVTLALGEVTGHAHTMTGAVAEFAVKDGRRLLWVEAPTPLVHQEHAPIEVASGWYWIIRQREYSPEAIRDVAD
jgi:hypothetical protein